MIGAILGDLIGSVYEFRGIKTKDFPLFTEESQITDDSYLTMAIFQALEKANGNYTELGKLTVKELVRFYIRYPNPYGGYGSLYLNWVDTVLQTRKIQPPYNSYGNGSAMRISPVPYFSNSLEECIELSRKVTEVTHNHPEGIKGAEATAVATYLALQGKTKAEIKEYIRKYYYKLDQTCDEIRKIYRFNGSCQGTVPEAIQAFLESNDFVDAIRLTISLGGDADTMGAITGAIAGAYYGVPKELVDKLFDYLDDYCKGIVKRIIEKYGRLK